MPDTPWVTPVAPGLLLLADGRLPTGGHAHSGGVEAAVLVGDVVDLASTERYLTARLASTGAVDAAFAAAACWIVSAETLDAAAVAELDAELDARTLSPYLRAVSRRQGRQLLRTARRVWPDERLRTLVDGSDPHQPIALGAAAAVAGASPADAAALTLHHLSGAVTTAAVRLLGLDPADLAAVAASATASALDRLLPHLDLTRCPADLPAWGGTLSEILGEHHGALPARLFVG